MQKPARSKGELHTRLACVFPHLETYVDLLKFQNLGKGFVRISDRRGELCSFYFLQNYGKISNKMISKTFEEAFAQVKTLADNRIKAAFLKNFGKCLGEVHRV